MPAKLLEKLERSGDTYGFGTVAVRADTAALVVITEVPEELSFPAVNVSEIDGDGDGALLRAAGTIPLDKLWVISSETPWSVDKVAECIVRAEFGTGAGEDVISGFREIFERHAARSPIAA